MSTPLGDALRERLELRTILTWFALMAGLYFLGSSPLQLATTVTISAIFGLNNILADIYDLRESIKHSGLGAVAVLGGVTLAVSGDAVLLSIIFLIIGSWFILDVVQTIRHEGITEPPRDGHDVYHNYVARRVHEILKEHPQTRRELGESLDADDEAIDMAVERLLDRDVIKQTGSEFRVSPSSDRGWEWIAGRVNRVAQPITIEFSGDTPDSTHDDQNTTGDSNTADSRGEREPEPAEKSL